MEVWEIMLIMIGVVMWVFWMLIIMGVVKGALYYRRQFERQLNVLEALNQRWDQMSVHEQQSKQSQAVQAFGRLSQLQSQLNSITRQQHQNRISSLTGLAAKAGITNWHP
jgi:hypothetical protein